MRRKLLGLFTIIWIVSLGFIGCSDSSSDDDYTTYKAEVGVISNSTYDAAMTKISYWNDFTYSNVASLRLYLYNNTLSDHEIQTGITLEEIRDFLLSKGFDKFIKLPLGLNELLLYMLLVVLRMNTVLAIQRNHIAQRR